MGEGEGALYSTEDLPLLVLARKTRFYDRQNEMWTRVVNRGLFVGGLYCVATLSPPPPPPFFFNPACAY